MVRDVKLKVYENFYNDLRLKDGEVKIFKLVRLRDKNSKDIEDVRCIKNEEDKLLIKDDDVQDH